MLQRLSNLDFLPHFTRYRVKKQQNIQLLMMALAIGTGVGINTAMAARFGVKKRESAQEFAGIGTPLAGILWILFAATTWFLMPAYALRPSPPSCSGYSPLTNKW